MSDQDDRKIGHDSIPDKKQIVGHDDANLIDLDNTDDEDNLVDAEDSEELAEVQVVDEVAPLLEQGDDSDEIQEIPGNMPDLLNEFDPINEVTGAPPSAEILRVPGDSLDLLHVFGPANEVTGSFSSEGLADLREVLHPSGPANEVIGSFSNEGLADLHEVLCEFDLGNEVVGASSRDNAQEAVEQQIVDLTGVPIEMVEERSGIQLDAEERPELAHGDTVKETSPRKSMSDEHFNPGQEDQSERNLNGLMENTSVPNSNEGGVSEGSSIANDQYMNLEPSVQGENDRVMNCTSEGHQGSNSSVEGQNGALLPASGHSPLGRVVNARQPGMSREVLEAELNLPEESPEANYIAPNERLDELLFRSPRCTGESLNATGGRSSQSAAESHAGIERQTDFDPDYFPTDVEDIYLPVEQEMIEMEHFNGGPGSGPDPSEEKEKVGNLAANGEAVARPEVGLEPEDNNNPDQIENIAPDEQDNLLEEQVEVLVAAAPDEQDNLLEELVEVLVAAVPEPLEPEQGANEEVIVVEEHGAAEAQMIQNFN